MYSNFLLGELNVHENVLRVLQREPLDLVARHAICEHGLVSEREREHNAIAIKTGDAIVSRYLIDPTNPARGRVMIVTRKGWDSTTVQLEADHDRELAKYKSSSR